MNDLEHDLRAMLDDRAAAVSPDPDARAAIRSRIDEGPSATVVPIEVRRSRRPVWIPAAAVAAVFAVVALVATQIDGDAPTGLSVATQPSDRDGGPRGAAALPALADSGESIFGVGAGYDDPNVAAEEYLRSREVGPHLELVDAVIAGDEAVARYASYEADPGSGTDVHDLASGEVVLWNSGDEWLVQSAMADEVAIDGARLTFDEGDDRLEIAGRSVSESGALALRVTSPSGDDLLPASGLPRGRAPLAADADGAFQTAVDVEPSAGHIQVVVEVLGGTVFAVTEFTIASPARALWRLPADTDAVAASEEFAASQGWSVTADGTLVDGPEVSEPFVAVPTSSGTVHVRFVRDTQGRFVVTGAWNVEFDHPAFTVGDGVVTGRWQAPVDGEATISITPFFSTFPDENLVPMSVVAGDIVHRPTSHPTNGYEPVTVTIRLQGVDGVERLATFTV